MTKWEPAKVGDPWIVRKYSVILGMKVNPSFEGLNGTRFFQIDGEQVAVMPNVEKKEDGERATVVQQITLSYPAPKAAALDARSDQAMAEVLERAEKVWKRDHPDDRTTRFVLYAARFESTKSIVNTKVEDGKPVAEASA